MLLGQLKFPHFPWGLLNSKLKKKKRRIQNSFLELCWTLMRGKLLFSTVFIPFNSTLHFDRDILYFFANSPYPSGLNFLWSDEKHMHFTIKDVWD